MNREALEAKRHYLQASIERLRQIFGMKLQVERLKGQLAEVDRQLKALEPAPCEMWAELREGMGS